MGNVVAAIIAFICFIFGTSVGGIAAGIIFALFMGGMSWFAFGSKGESDTKAKNPISFNPLPPAPNPSTPAPNQHNGPAFEFMDGKRLSPKEYGYFTSQWSLELAQKMLADFCGTGTEGALMPGKDAIKAKSGFALMYMTALHEGTYQAYAEHILHADQSIMNGVIQGTSDFLDGMTFGEGIHLEKDAKDYLLKLNSLFAKAVISDLKEALTMRPGTYRPPPTEQSSKLLLDVLDHLVRHDDKSRPYLFDEIWAPQYILGVALLDQAATDVLQILNKTLRVQLVGQS